MNKQELNDKGHLDSIRYLIQQKGDITRYSAWEKIKDDVEREYPELIKALRDLEIAEKMLNLVVEHLGDVL